MSKALVEVDLSTNKVSFRNNSCVCAFMSKALVGVDLSTNKVSFRKP